MPTRPADTDLDQAVDHGVHEAHRAGLEERRAARLEQLGRGKLARQPFLVLGIGGIQRHQPLEHVLLERRVVGHVATRQGLPRDVEMRVHHARRHDEARTTDARAGVEALRQVVALANRDDVAAANRHRTVEDHLAARVHRHHVRTFDEDIDRFGHQPSTCSTENSSWLPSGSRTMQM